MIDKIIRRMKQQTKMKTKLKLRPNDRCRSANITSFWLVRSALSSISLISVLIITVACESPISQHQNEVPHTGHVIPIHNSTANQLERDVKEFHMTSDFRAVKLRWNYEHTDANEPAAFTIRFCELTSWNVEIKCRLRDFQVQAEPPASLKPNQANSVITSPVRQGKTSIDTVHQLDPPRGSHYETQIYDLRALTNYTFQVRVARFSHEPAVAVSGLHQQAASNRSQAGRRLGGARQNELDWPSADEALRRIETKPFGAEATKCLSDVSEVLVNTGRYFGGRISVENSADPRCNLLGNKSSEQTSYLFRIDHEICDSKVVDGNRIETMVLVHENKDILTHNTARFLVLCNFLQKSFTLRASISLPKVNGLMAQSRPAVITSLARKPESNLNSTADERATSVLLGSMPGIYRARVVHQSEASGEQQLVANQQEQQQQQQQQQQQTQSASNAKTTSPTPPKVVLDANFNSTRALADELETNTIEKIGAKNGHNRPSAAKLSIGNQADQQLSAASEPEPSQTANLSAGLVRRRNSNGFEQAASGNRARALTLSSAESAGGGGGSSSSSLPVPQPVQVQSKLLFVERGADMARTGRRHHYNRLSATSVGSDRADQRQVAPNLAPASRLDTIEVLQRATTTPPQQMHIQIQPKANNADADNNGQRVLKQSASGRPIGGNTNSAAAAIADDAADPQTAPITIRNNHRISGDYPQIGGLNAKPLGENNSDFSIKYSGLAKIDDYPVESRAGADELNPEGSNHMSNLLMRVRSGRMRSVLANEQQQQQLEQSGGAPVSRMGEMSSESGADLLAETSNETATRQQFVTSSPVQNSTLAQNITSYLLKWSLKTLTNLAKKSLETLIEHEPIASRINETDQLVGGVQNEAQLTPNSSENIDHELRSSIHHLEPIDNRQVLAAPKPSVPAETNSGNSSSSSSSSKKPDSLEPAQVAKRGGVSATGSSATAVGNQQDATKSSDGMLDGFITGSKRPEEKANQTKARPKQVHPISELAQLQHQHQYHQQHPHQQAARPSNYSKSLDLSRAETAAKAKNAGERAKLNAAGQRHKASPVEPATSNSASREQQEQVNETPQWNESVWSGRDGSIFHSSWLFCSIALFVALITGIFLTLWLISAPSRGSSSATLEQQTSHDNCTGGHPPIAFNNPSLPRLTFNEGANSGGPAGCGGSLSEPSYQRYDYKKFERSYPNEAANDHKANLLPTIGAKMGRASAQSPSTESQSTRSTSAGSTLLAAEENDCKNNEFLYTGHVLLNTGSCLGESYA